MPRVGIALGSNLGDRAAHLEAARAALREIATPGEPFLAARDHETAPLDCPPGSPAFLNSVIELDFLGTAFELLALTQAIEKQLGRRVVPERNAPRVIDIDLLYFGAETFDTDDLVRPPPRRASRAFVMTPLAEIRPDWFDGGNFCPP